MTKANHRANLVVIGEILPHPNADKLEITHIEGYQCVIGKGSFKTGDIAVYIQPDSIVPQTEPFRFIWGDHVGIDGTVPEKRRRITVKRLRKEYSEGLLMPLGDLVTGYIDIIRTGDVIDSIGLSEGVFHIGDDVAPLFGITHYVPEFDRESTAAETAAQPRRRYPKTLKGWWFFLLHRLGFKGAGKSLALEVAFNFPVYDVDALKNHKNWIPEDSLVTVTEKIHGSNARYVFIDGKQYCGSHYQWKKDGDNIFWKAFRAFPQIGEWCRENEGRVLYGEVGPTQKGFTYGTTDGEPFFFAFDVYDPKTGNWYWPGGITMGFAPCVPIIAVERFSQATLKHADGQSVVPGAKHIREGIVIRKFNSPVTLKVVSNQFLEKDSQ